MENFTLLNNSLSPNEPIKFWNPQPSLKSPHANTLLGDDVFCGLGFLWTNSVRHFWFLYRGIVFEVGVGGLSVLNLKSRILDPRPM